MLEAALFSCVTREISDCAGVARGFAHDKGCAPDWIAPDPYRLCSLDPRSGAVVRWLEEPAVL
jgi:hypothetical protein